MRFVTVLAVLAVVLVIVVLSCGRGHRQAVVPPDNSSGVSDSVPDLPTDPNAPERNVMIVRSIDLTRLNSDSEFDVTVAYKFHECVYQGSGRILYDDEIVEPIKFVKGTGIPNGAVFFCRTTEKDYVPFAFTSLEDQAGLQPGEGSLLTVTFRLKKKTANGYRLRLLNTAEFLQLRDKTGKRLSFDLSSEVVSK